MGQAVPLSYLFLVQGALNLGSQIFLMPGGGGTVACGLCGISQPLPRPGDPRLYPVGVANLYLLLVLIVGGPIFLV